MGLIRRRIATVASAALLAGTTATTVAVLQATPAHASGKGLTVTNGASCLNSTTPKCNKFMNKEDVWLDAGNGNLQDGTYFFAVSAPGGQSDPKDSNPKNLSSQVDFYTVRTFTVDGGHVTDGPSGHTADGDLIPLSDYGTTPNNGGVYVLSVCSLANGYPNVSPSDCQVEAFKVTSSESNPPPCDPSCPQDVPDPPTADKTAVPTHTRTVSWAITKTNDAPTPEIDQLTSKTVNYTVTATKSSSDTYGVTGTINVYNTNAADLPVTVSDTGLDPSTNETCKVLNASSELVSSVSVTVPSGGLVSVDYSCSLTIASPNTLLDLSVSHQNTASVGYDLTSDGSDPQTLPVLSSSFSFPAITPATLTGYETIHVTDAFNSGAATSLSGSSGVSATTQWQYSHVLFNPNCHKYDNTATITETSQTASSSATFCGPDSGGLTMGWWQNKNGQTLLTSNLTFACGTFTGYLPTTFIHGAGTYLADAYTTYYKATGYQFDSSKCSGPVPSKSVPNNSYLPTFTTNVFTAANASGTGTWMVEGQYLTTALNTASYPLPTVWTAGRPGLSSGLGIKIPAALQGTPAQAGNGVGIALGTCAHLGDLLTNVAQYFPNYAASKGTVTPALITLLTQINENKAQTCTP